MAAPMASTRRHWRNCYKKPSPTTCAWTAWITQSEYRCTYCIHYQGFSVIHESVQLIGIHNGQYNIYVGCAVLLCLVVCLTLLASFFLPSPWVLGVLCCFALLFV